MAAGSSPTHAGSGKLSTTDGGHRESACTRRALVRHGAKLAFVTPVLTTFFANTAYAGTWERSCLKNGSPCTEDAWCCSGNCDTIFTGQCIPSE